MAQYGLSRDRLARIIHEKLQMNRMHTDRLRDADLMEAVDVLIDGIAAAIEANNDEIARQILDRAQRPPVVS